MLALCETASCRRVDLLAYFGESAGPCGNCDTCLHPPETWDATIPAQKLLSTVLRLDRERRERYGAGQIIDILRGHATDRTRSRRHETLATWGIGEDLSQAEWRAVTRALLASGALAVGPGGHGVLVLTEASWAVMRGLRPLHMRRDLPMGRLGGRTGARSGGEAAPGRAASRFEGELTADAAGVFERLRAWRAGIAKERGVPAYVVFHDATLRSMAAGRPASLDALSKINGVGEAKLAAYGEAVLEILAGSAGEEEASAGNDPQVASPPADAEQEDQ
jgi:ATP-dependent DNA helicase RecQ